MKKSLMMCVLIGLALSPLRAQMATPDTSQDSKTTDSTADKHVAATGNSTDPSVSPDSANSKNGNNSVDKNPSTAPTDSADKSATKDPNATTGSPWADQRPASNSAETEKTSDSAFILKAAQGGMTEVELGKLAEQKASSQDVKQFGSHMVMDHSKADSDLKAVAEKKGITVPSKLDAKHQAMVDRFQNLSGPDFDRAYVHAMVKDHEKDAAEFREESTNAQDSDVKSFAGNALKVIETHLADIKSIQSKIK